jgi:carboxypeptidase Taq
MEISRYLLDYIGFDNSRGALGIYTHGYTIKMNNNDVRIAFSNESDIFDHMSTIIHEGGHGIFEQNIDESLKKFGNYDIDKVALHESQSRFYENILGRNINFWIPIYDDIKKLLNIDMDINDFVDVFNNAHTSLIRTKADELTYCMHIIIRYEIEKEIFNGNIDLNNLDKLWNQKYKEYLNLDVTSDKDGILQDMHWSDGSFGYFPTYLLGSIFDGMLLEQINKDLENTDELLKNGKIKEITTYLNNNIHKNGGAYNINEVSQKLCGRSLDVKPLINYFKNKYGNN